ncbi:MAG: hypothetical protein ABIM89_14955 [Mycobacteriales bacterium]
MRWRAGLPVVVLALSAGCSGSGPRALKDATGNRVPQDVAEIYRGEAHCDWESLTIVLLGKRKYIADPKHKIVAPGQYVGEYAASVPVPADAVDTGYRSGKLQVFEANDKTYAYLSKGATAQRLPAAVPGFGCD